MRYGCAVDMRIDVSITVGSKHRLTVQVNASAPGLAPMTVWLRVSVEPVCPLCHTVAGDTPCAETMAAESATARVARAKRESEQQA